MSGERPKLVNRLRARGEWAFASRRTTKTTESFTSTKFTYEALTRYLKHKALTPLQQDLGLQWQRAEERISSGKTMLGVVLRANRESILDFKFEGRNERNFVVSSLRPQAQEVAKQMQRGGQLLTSIAVDASTHKNRHQYIGNERARVAVRNLRDALYVETHNVDGHIHGEVTKHDMEAWLEVLQSVYKGVYGGGNLGPERIASLNVDGYPLGIHAFSEHPLIVEVITKQRQLKGQLSSVQSNLEKNLGIEGDVYTAYQALVEKVRVEQEFEATIQLVANALRVPERVTVWKNKKPLVVENARQQFIASLYSETISQEK